MKARMDFRKASPPAAKAISFTKLRRSMLVPPELAPLLRGVQPRRMRTLPVEIQRQS